MQSRSRQSLARGTLAAMGLACSFTLHAQTFPARPLRIVVAFPAGGGTDIAARIVGQKMGESLGQQVVIDNRGGAAGIVGTDLAAKASADGYTLFMGKIGRAHV